MKEVGAMKTVTLTEPEFEGSYEVEELESGDLLLRRRLTTLAEIEQRHGLQPATVEEFEAEHGRTLPHDDEG
jgi:hypothetical protein